MEAFDEKHQVKETRMKVQGTRDKKGSRLKKQDIRKNQDTRYSGQERMQGLGNKTHERM